MELQARPYEIHPDFVIKFPDKRRVYWEHLGKLDDRKYYKDWQRRKEDYLAEALIEAVVTTDDLDRLEDVKVEAVIDDIRNNRLRSTPENRFSIHHYELY